MPLVLATSQDEPQAPVHMLTEVQREALVTLLFVGELTRMRGRFIAPADEHCPEVEASTALALMKKEMILLRCRKEKNAKGHRPLYRYTIALTQRGQWYARTVLRQRQQGDAAFDANVSAMMEAAE